jgi:hypothetical protein
VVLARNADRTVAMVALGYGKFARADRIYALVPLEGEQRGDRRRTLVHVDGIDQPLVASRSEAAILRDLAAALGHEDPAAALHERRPQQPTLF